MKTSLSGATLVESLVASIIILSVIGISAMVIAGSLRSNSSLPELQALCVADSLYEQVLEQGTYSETDFLNHEMKFTLNFSAYPLSDNLLRMTVVATTINGDIVGEFNYLIPDY